LPSGALLSLLSLTAERKLNTDVAQNRLDRDLLCSVCSCNGSWCAGGANLAVIRACLWVCLDSCRRYAGSWVSRRAVEEHKRDVTQRRGRRTVENLSCQVCEDGRLAAGDQLLSVDGRSLVGLAAELMTRTGSVVTLEVAKQGAIYHGLATLLNQPSPMMQRASDRARDKNGKMRPKSEGFELYNNTVQNGDPESPQPGWDSYAEPKKMSGEDRLLKNRVDHRSSPNVANQGQSPATKSVYPGGPGTKITSVSTGNLCADEEPSPPHPEAYPIPTQTYPREYFTIPASKSQDRVVGPVQVPPQHWQGMEDRERLPVVDNIHNNSMQEDLYPPPGIMRPDERMQPLYPQDYQHRDLDYQHRASASTIQTGEVVQPSAVSGTSSRHCLQLCR
ncbi:hypothetical protein GOODEAATRI_001527, partial [Goodea atripinnis]